MTGTDSSSAAHGTPTRATAAWLMLVGATALAWLMGEREAAGPAFFAMLFVLAFAKGMVVILDFMALRRAPLLWPLLVAGWLALVCVLVGLAYWKGIPT